MGRVRGIDFSDFERRRNGDAMDEDSDEDEAEEQGALDENEYESRKKRYLTKIEELSAKLADLQPNMKALEQYQKIRDKVKDGRTESKEARDEVTAVNRKVEAISDKRERALKGCFEVVARNIKRIYAELTASRQYPTGGKAYLNHGSSASHIFDDEIAFNAM